MTGWYKAQIALQDISELPRDRYVSVFNLWKSGPSVADPIALAAACEGIGAFYNRLTSYMSPAVNKTDSTIAIYDMLQPKDTPPVRKQGLFATVPGGASIPSGTPLPTELATCLTLKAQPTVDPVHTKPLSGRIYFGPLNHSGVADADTGNPEKHSRVAQELREALVNAAKILMTDLSTAGWAWMVYSPTRGYLARVKSFAVDDSWDIQRRRGDRPVNYTRAPAFADEASANFPVGDIEQVTPHGAP